MTMSGRDQPSFRRLDHLRHQRRLIPQAIGHDRMTVEGLGLSILPIDMMQEEIAHNKLAVVTSRTKIPPNRFLVAQQSDSFDATIGLISDLAVELAKASGIFRA